MKTVKEYIYFKRLPKIQILISHFGLNLKVYQRYNCRQQLHNQSNLIMKNNSQVLAIFSQIESANQFTVESQTSSNFAKDDSILQQKTNSLQTNYSQLESHYFRTIKELKGRLNERTRKQIMLNAEVAKLRQEYIQHQAEIVKITEVMSTNSSKKPKSNEPKNLKSSSPLGMIKKSLDHKNETKIPFERAIGDGQSINNIQIIEKKPVKEKEELKKYDMNPQKKKNYSPKNSNQTHFLEELASLPYNKFQRKQKLKILSENQTNKTSGSNKDQQEQKVNSQSETKQCQNNVSDKIVHQKQKSPNQNPKKKHHSPKNVELKGFLINSVKNTDKGKITPLLNASPKRITRASPTTGVIKTGDVEGSKRLKKETKKYLTGLKQSMEDEAF